MVLLFLVYTFFYFYLVRRLKFPEEPKFFPGIWSYYNHYRLENVSQYSVTEYTQDKWCGREVHIYYSSYHLETIRLENWQYLSIRELYRAVTLTHYYTMSDRKKLDVTAVPARLYKR